MGPLIKHQSKDELSKQIIGHFPQGTGVPCVCPPRRQAADLRSSLRETPDGSALYITVWVPLG